MAGYASDIHLLSGHFFFPVVKTYRTDEKIKKSGRYRKKSAAGNFIPIEGIEFPGIKQGRIQIPYICGDIWIYHTELLTKYF